MGAFSDLPDEVIINTLLFTGINALGSIATTQQRLLALSQSNKLWESILQPRLWPQYRIRQPRHNSSWYRQFIAHAQIPCPMTGFLVDENIHKDHYGEGELLCTAGRSKFLLQDGKHALQGGQPILPDSYTPIPL